MTTPGLALADIRIETDLGARTLVVTTDDDVVLHGFEGDATDTPTGRRLTGVLTARNARAVRALRPNLVPAPIGLRTSAGTGDRLGMATPGHVQAFRQSAPRVRPVFAQQSIREMDRLGRTPQQVLDDATFGCLEAGWDGPVGADADHLKTTADIDRCLAAGFSLFTIDVGDFVNDPSGVDPAALPWAELADDLDSARRRYASLAVDLGPRAMTVSDAELAHAMGKYGRAVAEGARMYRHLRERADYPVEVEIAVDETDEPTTAAEHVYIATELARLGVTWVSFAPRHLGSFEKGVEFEGDRAALDETIGTHAAIARALGPYKIGMHSGSDKFSIYGGLMEQTEGLVHLKTSGTSYLVALGVLARTDPDLFRAAYAASVAAYRSARDSYQVSADEQQIPDPAAVPNAELPALLTARATRQVLHVGYGAVLRDGCAESVLGRDVMCRLAKHRDDYTADLAAHLGRHLEPFADACLAVPK